jgi:hypothetical protein
MKELDILPAPVAQPPAEIPRASDVTAAPLAEESVSQHNTITRTKTRREQEQEYRK